MTKLELVGRRCSHRNQTIVCHEELLGDFLFDFVGWQCDDCGMLVRRDVTDDDVMTNTVAKLDKIAYEKAIDQAIMAAFEIPTARPEVKAAQFIQAAVKDARQRRSDRKR